MHQQSSTYISTCYRKPLFYKPDTHAFLGQCPSQETEATSKEDLEDFVQWRRRQPGNAKAMVSAECEARMSRSSIHHLRARVDFQPDQNQKSESDENQKGQFFTRFKTGGVKCMQMYGKFGGFPREKMQCLGWS